MKIYFWKDIEIKCQVKFDVAAIEFKMFEVVGYSEGLLGLYDVPLYEKKRQGEETEIENTENIKEAQEYISGRIKWDACSHIYFGDEGYIHICGGRSWRQIIEALKRIFQIAREYFKEPHQKEMFDEFDESQKT